MPLNLPDLDPVLQQYFDKIFVLTVPRFLDRQERIRQKLEGIHFEFFYGTDKQDLTESYIRSNYSYDKNNSLAIRRQFPPLNKGEIACALSHRDIYRSMVEHNWKHVLVFEDDVVPVPENLGSLGNCLKELPPDWDLFYLGYLKNERPDMGRKLKRSWYLLQARMGLSRMPVKMIRRTLPAPFSLSLYRAGFHDCTHAYALSLAAAKKLLQAQTPVIHRADNLLSALVLKGELNAFISRRHLFNQEIFADSSDPSHVRENQKK